MLRPFIGDQDHRLGEVQRAEVGIDRDGDDLAGQRDLLRLQPGTLGAEQDGRTPAIGMDLAAGLFRRDHGDDQAALSDRGRIDMGAVRDGLGDRLSNTRARSSTTVGAGGGRARRRIGPAVPRRDEAQVGQPEIEHRPRRLADILAELGPDEDDGG